MITQIRLRGFVCCYTEVVQKMQFAFLQERYNPPTVLLYVTPRLNNYKQLKKCKRILTYNRCGYAVRINHWIVNTLYFYVCFTVFSKIKLHPYQFPIACTVKCICYIHLQRMIHNMIHVFQVVLIYRVSRAYYMQWMHRTRIRYFILRG